MPCQASIYTSLVEEIGIETDSQYFEKWAKTIESKNEFNKFEKIKLVEKFIQRTSDLGLTIINNHFIYRKALQLTIDGNYDEALKLLNKVYPVFVKHKKYLLMSACLNSQGYILAKTGNARAGKKKLENALVLCQKSEIEDSLSYRSLSNHYNVLGVIYGKLKKQDSALIQYQKAYQLSLQGTRRGSQERSYCLSNLAFNYLQNQQYDSALQYGRLTLQEGTIGKNKYIKGYAYLRIGLAKKGLKQIDSALFYFKLMEDLAMKFNYKELNALSNEQQSEIYQMLGNTQVAYKKLAIFSSLKLEIEKENNRALTNYLIEESHRQNAMESQVAIGKEKIKSRNLQLFGSILIAILIISLFALYLRFQRKKLKQKIADEQVKIALMQSQIKTIGAQMNPHFVFNALNSVQDLILQRDVRSSSIYLAKFADLMRNTLDASQKDNIDIDKEIENLELYLSLEALRFEDNQFSYSITEHNLNRLNDTKIPTMFIQPYVENAIKHGLLHKNGLKKLNISFTEVDNKLKCVILDNGIGRNKSAEINRRRKEKHDSFATNANAKRLELINNSSAQKIKVDITDLMDDNNQSMGTEVSISFE